MPFLALGLSPSLARPLAKLGYRRQRRSNSKAIPIVLSGRDVVVRARRRAQAKLPRSDCRSIDRLLVRGGSTSWRAQAVRPRPRADA